MPIRGSLIILFLTGADGEDLIRAARLGKVKVVEGILQKGVNVNRQDYEGNTALMYAAEKGYLSVVKRLIEHRANVNLRRSDGPTALMTATK